MKSHGFWPTFWMITTFYGLWGFPLYLIGIMLRWGFNIKLILALLASLVVTLLLTTLVRVTVKRERPNLDLALYRPSFSSTSFPSAHTSAAFSMATSVAVMHLNLAGLSWKFALMLGINVGLAALIGYSRVAVGVHHKLDIVAGAILGTTIGLIGTLLILSL